MDGRLSRLLTGLAAGLVLISSTALSLTAADIQWKSERYSVTADKEPIASVLKNFAADQGLSIEVAEDVTGDVSGRFDSTPAAFLDSFVQQNGLAWYYDGVKLFITSSSAVTTNIYKLQNAQASGLIDALKQVGIYSDRYPIQFVEDLGLIYVAGPPRYQELVSLTLQTVEAINAPNTRTRLSTRVYRLKYAWADDQVVLFRDSEVILPGVATTLRNLVNGQGSQARFIPGGNVARTPSSLQGLNGTGLARFGGQPVNYGSPIYGQFPPPVLPATPSQAGAVVDPPPVADDAIGPPSIQPDARLNAVIVQDVATRFPAYDKLIAELDVPGGLVEIEATILDIDADSGFDFGAPAGIEWQRGGEAKQAGFSLDPTDLAPTSLTLVSAQATEFALRLQALRNRGQAEIVSKPSVLTINNVEAQLDSTQTFFVRVAGQLQVDLFDVVVGTSLRVTPHIVEEDSGNRRIQLLIKVEDGTQSDQAVDGIPTIVRSTINTQAVLNEDETLLIGGLIRTEQRSRRRGIPGLMDIPKVGFLFANTETRSVRSQRYIMLKPRIVELPNNLTCEPIYYDGGIQQSPMFPQVPYEQQGSGHSQQSIPGMIESLPPNGYLNDNANGGTDAAWSPSYYNNDPIIPAVPYDR